MYHSDVMGLNSVKYVSFSIEMYGGCLYVYVCLVLWLVGVHSIVWSCCVHIGVHSYVCVECL